MRKIIILFFIFIILSITLNAQEKWNLEKCIDHAINNNITIKQSALNTQSSRENLFKSKADLLPYINGYFEHDIAGPNIVSDSATRNYYSGSMGVNANLNLFNGFQSINTIKKNSYLFWAAEMDEENSKNQLAISIINIYMQILYNLEFKEIAIAQLDIIEDHINKTESLVTAGATTKSELLKLQYQKASEQVTLTQVDNDLNNSYLYLTQFLELAPGETENFEIEKYENLMPMDTIDFLPIKLYTISEGIMPQIKAMEFEIKSYQKDLDIANSLFFPKLSLFYNYNSRYDEIYDPNPLLPPSSYSISDQITDYRYYGLLGIRLDVPIFNGFTAKNRRSLSKIQKLNAEYYLENEKKELFKEIQTSYNNMKSARESYNMQEKALNYAKESFRYAQQQIEAGVISALDFNMEKNTLIKAESEFLQAKYSYIFSLKLLNFYAGNDIRK